MAVPVLSLVLHAATVEASPFRRFVPPSPSGEGKGSKLTFPQFGLENLHREVNDLIYIHSLIY
jgi:hypothetical protein